MHPHDFWTDRLSEALDGTLPAGQLQALEEHLAGCPACRRVRDELAEVRRRARALEAAPPETDLWTRIAAALPEPRPAGETARVIPIPLRAGDAGPSAPATTPDPEPGRWRRLRRSPLASAAAVVALLGLGAWGGSIWSRDEASPPVGLDRAGPVSGQPLRAAAGGAVQPSLFAELSRLEEALRGDLGRLDPGTREVILANLATIDRAIRESVRALEADPGSGYLRGHLGTALRRKVGYLQTVTRILES